MFKKYPQVKRIDIEYTLFSAVFEKYFNYEYVFHQQWWFPQTIARVDDNCSDNNLRQQ